MDLGWFRLWFFRISSATTLVVLWFEVFQFYAFGQWNKVCVFFFNWLYVFLHLTWWVLAGANENYDIKTMQWHHHFVTMETSWLGIKGSSASPGKRGQHIIPVWWWSKYHFGFNHPYYLSILLKCNNLLYLVWIHWSLKYYSINNILYTFIKL